MKKKLLTVMLVCLMAFTACGKDEEKKIGGADSDYNATGSGQGSTNEGGVDNSANVVKGYTFDYNGTVISVDMKMDSLLEKLGKEDSYFEAPSCAFEGIAKTYTYGSMQLSTYIGEDGDYLDAIVLKDDLITTPEGAKIGDTPEHIIEIYGSNYTDNNGSYSYTKDGMNLNIIIEDGAVVSIQYKSSKVG